MASEITQTAQELEEGEIDEEGEVNYNDDGDVVVVDEDDDDCVVMYVQTTGPSVGEAPMAVDNSSSTGVLNINKRRTLLPTPRNSERLNGRTRGESGNGCRNRTYLQHRIKPINSTQRQYASRRVAGRRSQLHPWPEIRDSRLNGSPKHTNFRTAPMTMVRPVYRSKLGICVRRRGGKAVQANKRTQSLTPGQRTKLLKAAPKLHTCGSEPTYEDLLAQYREIQSQLEELTQEEEKQGCAGVKTAAGSLDKENIKSEDTDYIGLQFASQRLKNLNRERLKRARRRRRRRQSLRSSDHNVQGNDSEPDTAKNEDDDELELRRIALDSTLGRRRRTLGHNKSDGTSVSRSVSMTSSASRKSDAVCAVTIEDNYEEVLMDLDSVPTSPTGETKGKLQKTTDSDVDEDVDILRAKLLSSLSNKQLEKNLNLDFIDLALANRQELSTETVIPKNPLVSAVGRENVLPLNGSSSKTLPPSVLRVPPVHKPVVIHLNDEESDSEPDVDGDAVPGVSSLSCSIDSFLIEARQKSDQAKQSKCEVPQSSSFQAPRNVCLHDAADSKGPSTKHQKGDIAEGHCVIASSVVNEESVSLPLQSLQDQLKNCEAQLLEQKKEMLDCQRELQKLKLQMSSKATILKSSEVKIAKLREQVAAALKVADAHKASLTRLEEMHDDLTKDVDSKKSRKIQLENECVLVGRRLHGDSYQLPQVARVLAIRRKLATSYSVLHGKVADTDMLNKGVGPLASSFRRTKLTLKELANEKARLKKLELKVASKLQELRQNATALSVPKSSVEQKIMLHVRKSVNSPLKRERRQSFMEKNPSTKPELTHTKDDVLMKDCGSSLQVATEAVALTDQQLDKIKKFDSSDPLLLDDLVCVPLTSFDVHTIFQPSQVPFAGCNLHDASSSASDVGSQSLTLGPLKTYSSPLLHFRSYRFSPYFRNKANQCLTWPTYTQKLLTRKTFCRFDLTGTCNDEKCVWQHARDYMMTQKEVLADIVSHCSSLAEVPDDASEQESRQRIESYVDKLLSSNHDRVTFDQLCILTVGRVNEAMGKAAPHYVTFDERRWWPGQRCTDVSDTRVEKRKMIADSKWNAPDVGDVDDTISHAGARYFSSNGDCADAMECAVVENPEDVNLWLKLAYKRLQSREGSPDLCLDMALNVLSRGLEKNQKCAEMWIHYLGLYSKRSDCSDLPSLCQQAVKFAPCYDVWWKYAKGYQAKREICSKLFHFVLHSDTDAETKSHQLVEVLLYNVQLNVLSGRCGLGQSLLEEALGERKGTGSTPLSIVGHLTSFDQCLLWLCNIHLQEFHCLPTSSLFGPSNSGLGKIVCKVPFLLPWKSGHKFKMSVRAIRNLFMTALKKCVRKGQHTSVNAQVCLPLYRNLMALEQIRNKHHVAIDICRQLLKVAATAEVFVLMAMMYNSIGAVYSVTETLDTALKSDLCSTPSVFYVAAEFELKKGNTERACYHVGTCVSRFFDLDDNQLESCLSDPEPFYRNLLQLPDLLENRDFGVKLPPSYVAGQRLYLWLNYCVFLTARDRHKDVVEAYETAILQMSSVADLQIVWLHYLQYVLQQATTVTHLPECNFQHFSKLVHRCLTSVPCKVPLSGSALGKARSRLDYTFFNRIVELYVHAFDEGQAVKAYEMFSRMAPGNANVTMRLLNIYMESGRYQDAWYFAKGQLVRLPTCWHLWKVNIYLAKRRQEIFEVRRLYNDVCKVLPYNIVVWKEFISFELAQGQLENAKILINQCRQLGVNIDGFLYS